MGNFKYTGGQEITATVSNIYCDAVRAFWTTGTDRYINGIAVKGIEDDNNMLTDNDYLNRNMISGIQAAGEHSIGNILDSYTYTHTFKTVDMLTPQAATNLTYAFVGLTPMFDGLSYGQTIKSPSIVIKQAITGIYTDKDSLDFYWNIDQVKGKGYISSANYKDNKFTAYNLPVYSDNKVTYYDLHVDGGIDPSNIIFDEYSNPSHIIDTVTTDNYITYFAEDIEYAANYHKGVASHISDSAAYYGEIHFGLSNIADNTRLDLMLCSKVPLGQRNNSTLTLTSNARNLSDSSTVDKTMLVTANTAATSVFGIGNIDTCIMGVNNEPGHAVVLGAYNDDIYEQDNIKLINYGPSTSGGVSLFRYATRAANNVNGGEVNITKILNVENINSYYIYNSLNNYDYNNYITELNTLLLRDHYNRLGNTTPFDKKSITFNNHLANSVDTVYSIQKDSSVLLQSPDCFVQQRIDYTLIVPTVIITNLYASSTNAIRTISFTLLDHWRTTVADGTSISNNNTNKLKKAVEVTIDNTWQVGSIVAIYCFYVNPVTGLIEFLNICDNNDDVYPNVPAQYRNKIKEISLGEYPTGNIAVYKFYNRDLNFRVYNKIYDANTQTYVKPDFGDFSITADYQRGINPKYTDVYIQNFVYTHDESDAYTDYYLNRVNDWTPSLTGSQTKTPRTIEVDLMDMWGFCSVDSNNKYGTTESFLPERFRDDYYLFESCSNFNPFVLNKDLSTNRRAIMKVTWENIPDFSLCVSTYGMGTTASGSTALRVYAMNMDYTGPETQPSIGLFTTTNVKASVSNVPFNNLATRKVSYANDGGKHFAYIVFDIPVNVTAIPPIRLSKAFVSIPKSLLDKYYNDMYPEDSLNRFEVINYYDTYRVIEYTATNNNIQVALSGNSLIQDNIYFNGKGYITLAPHSIGNSTRRTLLSNLSSGYTNGLTSIKMPSIIGLPSGYNSRPMLQRAEFTDWYNKYTTEFPSGTAINFPAISSIGEGITTGNVVKINGCLDLSNIISPQMTMGGMFQLQGVDATTVILPKTLTTIGSHAVCHMPQLHTLCIPGSVTSISSPVGCSCPKLSLIKFGGTLNQLKAACEAGGTTIYNAFHTINDGDDTRYINQNVGPYYKDTINTPIMISCIDSTLFIDDTDGSQLNTVSIGDVIFYDNNFENGSIDENVAVNGIPVTFSNFNLAEYSGGELVITASLYGIPEQTTPANPANGSDDPDPGIGVIDGPVCLAEAELFVIDITNLPNHKSPTVYLFPEMLEAFNKYAISIDDVMVIDSDGEMIYDALDNDEDFYCGSNTFDVNPHFDCGVPVFYDNNFENGYILNTVASENGVELTFPFANSTLEYAVRNLNHHPAVNATLYQVPLKRGETTLDYSRKAEITTGTYGINFVANSLLTAKLFNGTTSDIPLPGYYFMIKINKIFTIDSNDREWVMPDKYNLDITFLCKNNNRRYDNYGLSSGTKWCTYPIGADTYGDMGLFFRQYDCNGHSATSGYDFHVSTNIPLASQRNNIKLVINYANSNYNNFNPAKYYISNTVNIASADQWRELLASTSKYWITDFASEDVGIDVHVPGLILFSNITGTLIAIPCYGYMNGTEHVTNENSYILTSTNNVVVEYGENVPGYIRIIQNPFGSGSNLGYRAFQIWTVQ